MVAESLQIGGSARRATVNANECVEAAQLGRSESALDEKKGVMIAE